MAPDHGEKGVGRAVSQKEHDIIPPGVAWRTAVECLGVISGQALLPPLAGSTAGETNTARDEKEVNRNA